MKNSPIVMSIIAGVSSLAFVSPVHAQAQPASEPKESDTIVVTGSRVITSGNSAPTPITVVSAERLAQTSPSNLPDAVRRLPQFSQEPAGRNVGAGGNVSTAATLNLRNFGANRNLILFDGTRVPPTAASGIVDTNLIPQALVERIDIVTGGASAVYGSDAVTGVVNFILNKKFNGIKTNTQYGISHYGDDASWRASIVGGQEIFGGRGHIEASYEHSDSDGIPRQSQRPLSKTIPTVVGDGTAAHPFTIIPEGRLTVANAGGVLLGLDITFKTNGVASPFVHGQPTNVVGVENGGDGGTLQGIAILSPLKTNQAFGRFDFDVTDDISYYAQASYADAKGAYTFSPLHMLGAFPTILSGNPYIPAPVQQLMNFIGLPAVIMGRFNNEYPGYITDHFSSNIYLKTGLAGTIFEDFKWYTDYSYARSKQRVIFRNNINVAKLAAATDVVLDPVSGGPVCQVSLTPFASRFPGCQPANWFGPTALSQAAFDFITDDTRYTLTNQMHIADFGVSGSPFSLWAGPVRVAISGEMRWTSLAQKSNAEPTVPPDCTGVRPTPAFLPLRLCTPDHSAYSTTTVSSIPKVSGNVKEIAAELLIPLLNDVPFVKNFELNLAGRYTDYSTSGSVETWKIGFSWQVSDELRFRGTRSRDIRAPTLVDLFQPLSSTITGHNDLHTGRSGAVNTQSQGNPNLVPEVGNTLTLGAVYQPHWLPGFSLAVDYYRIKIDNALANIDATNVDIQRECENSNGISPLCDLYVRPLPFSDRSPANFPTLVRTQMVNVAKQWTRGLDIEANYRFDADKVIGGASGTMGLRALAAYQPILKTQVLASLRPTQAAGIAGYSVGDINSLSKWRVNLTADYSGEDFIAAVTYRWQSHQHPSDPKTTFDLRPMVPAYSYTDIFLQYNGKVAGHTLSPFLTIENLFNKKPPLSGGSAAGTGLVYPVYRGYDVVGRYFTFGIKTKW